MMKTAVVTGASSGIGREFVRQIAGKYSWLDEIWVIARSAEKLEKLKEEVQEVSIRPLSLDIYTGTCIRYKCNRRVFSGSDTDHRRIPADRCLDDSDYVGH